MSGQSFSIPLPAKPADGDSYYFTCQRTSGENQFYQPGSMCKWLSSYTMPAKRKRPFWHTGQFGFW